MGVSDGFVTNLVSKLFSPVVFVPTKNVGIPNGISVIKYLESLPRDTWQQRIRYIRIRKGISADYMAEKLNIKGGNEYMKKYECDCIKHYTSVENYMKVCSVLEVDYEEIADDYMLFIASDYDKKLAQAIEKEGLNIVEFSKKYNLESTTLRHSLKRMHKLSYETYEKYQELFIKLGI